MSRRGWVDLSPEFNNGDQLKAKIRSIEQVPGNWGEQYPFELTTETGWKTVCWIPASESEYRIKRLAYTVMETFDENHSSVQESIDHLRQYGYVFVVCTGFRTRDGRKLPKFNIFNTELPVIYSPEDFHEQ